MTGKLAQLRQAIEAFIPDVHPTPGGESEPAFNFAVAVLLVLLTAWSLGTTEYGMCMGDAAGQVPLALHAQNPSLLNHDPIIIHYGAQYKSVVLTSAGVLGRIIPLPVAYCALLVVSRFLLIVAYYHLAFVLTNRRTTALLAVLTLTGFGYYSLGTYLGGVPLVEAYFVPRVAALPFALMALRTMVQEKYLRTAVLLGATILGHPPTGLGAVGLYIVYALMNYRPLRRDRFGLSLLIIACPILVGFFWAGQHTVGQRFIDDEWRRIIDSTCGPYIFVGQDKGWKRFFLAVLLGGLASLTLRSPRIRRVYLTLTVGAFLAIVVHYLGVDCLGLHVLMNADPERATFAVVAVSGIVSAALIAHLLIQSSILFRTVGGLLLLGMLCRADCRVIVVLYATAIVAAALAHRSVRQNRWAVGALAALGMATVTFFVFFCPVNGRSIPSAIRVDGAQALLEPAVLSERSKQGCFQGWEDIRQLGLRPVALQIESAHWIRDHSKVDDVICPPMCSAGSWQLFSERACCFGPQLKAYTFVSRPCAMETRAFLSRFSWKSDSSWSEIIRFAHDEAAQWVVIDEQVNAKRPSDPEPLFASGPYRVFRIDR